MRPNRPLFSGLFSAVGTLYNEPSKRIDFSPDLSKAFITMTVMSFSSRVNEKASLVGPYGY